ncbi:MAG: efflux RND transporter periplasmic adaptor subunit [Chloroflexi bacterium]|nr:efflux RND transporter periplasmic adaptor subunit [Chloroflexota bacterium]
MQHRVRTGSFATLLCMLIITSMLAACGAPAASENADADMTTVTRGNITATVSGSGSISAASTVNLAFQTSGTVAEILVDEGDTVTSGQALAILDTRDLALQVASAKAALDSANARLAQVTQGSTRPTELASAQAQLASAQAQLASARERLAALRNPSPSAISSAELRVTQAQTTLQTTRDNASATKTKAEIDLTKASESLLQAQSKFVNARDNWSWVQDFGTDPSTGRRISDAAENTYRDSFVAAESAVRTAEQTVVQAQVTVNNAREAEIANVAQAEQSLKDAQVQLDALRNPTASDIAAAIATVQQNEAAVASAQAQLDKIVVPGTETDVAIQQAAVTQAEQSLAQAQLRLDNATLKAPFAGVISAVNLVVGQVTSGTAIQLIDRDPLRIELSLSENDIVQVAVGDPVDITVDAIRDWQQSGSITAIAPAADTSSSVVAYSARIDFSDDDPRLLVGMTANLTIVTEQRENVLIVPNSALLPKGTGRVVQVMGDDGQPQEIDVTVGISDGIVSEVLSGLEEGQSIIATPTSRTNDGPDGPFGR